MTHATALVTGAAGFCGRHLVADLLAAGYRVAGLDRTAWSEPGTAVRVGDLADSSGLRTFLAEVQPASVFHLAALVNPRLTYEALHEVNVLGTWSLLQAVRDVCPTARVLVTGTSAVYGRVLSDELPIDESRPFHPANAYAVTKIGQEMIAYQHFAEHGLAVIRTRTFNLTGPGESPNFVTSAFARQIAEIEAGRRAPMLRVGNLDTVRDFVDVRDAVRAYRLLAEQGEPGAVYNVCSGQGTPIHTLLDSLLELARVQGITVDLDPGRLQPADVPVQVGDGTCLHTQTGWRPEFALKQTLHDVLAYWRQQIAEES